jgi:Ca2+-binding RTX toxin-like protein
MATVHGTDSAEIIFNPWVLAGSDTIYGHGGNDMIYAWSGNDTILGGAGADEIYGASGNDTAIYSDSTARVIVDLSTGLGIGGTAEGDTLDSIENLIGSSYSDLLIGTAGANVIEGGLGDDWLHGLAGDDMLDGSFGNDALHGGAGGDLMSGGSGVDTASYSSSAAGVTVLLNVDSAAGGDAEGDELDNIENLTGSAYGDDFWGDDGSNVLNGLNGNDSLKGFGGADSILGGSGNDTLWGMDGDDLLSGAAGNDSLRGGLNLDWMYGGGGADTFVWENTNETGLTAATADRIHDFNRAEGDRISLLEVDADVYAAGNQAFTFIGTAAFSGTPGEVRYYHLGADTYIEMQTGTSADVEGVIRIDGIHTPDASWFVL